MKKIILYSLFLVLFLTLECQGQIPSSCEDAAVSGPIQNLRRVVPGLYRGARPILEARDSGGVSTDLAFLKDNLGVRVILDLEHKEPFISQERAAWLNLGQTLEHVSIPMVNNRLTSPDVEMQALKVIVESLRKGKNVFVHCQAGRDRTGLMVAVFRMLYQNCGYQKARDEMLGIGQTYPERGASNMAIGWLKNFDLWTLKNIVSIRGQDYERLVQICRDCLASNFR